jgi:hypothetical protein
MKITLGGRYRIDELGDAFDRVLQNFRVNGVEEIQHVTVYLNLYQHKRTLALVDDSGERIEHLKFDGPTEREFRPVTDRVHTLPRTGDAQ